MIITVGKCYRSYLYLLGKALSKLISLFLIGSKSHNNIGLFGFCPIFHSFNFMRSIVSYFGYIIFGLIFFVFNKFKKEEQNEIQVRTAQRDGNFIYNNPEEIHEGKLYIRYIILSLSFVFYIEIKKVLYIEGFQFFNFWTVNIIFLSILMKKYFIIDFYKHHKVSIIFIVSACSALILAASFLPNSFFGKDSGNAYENINKKLGSYFYCILFIILFVGLSFIYSYTRVYTKVLMQIKFISPFKIIILFGIAGFPISIIASVVSYYIGYRDNIIKYFWEMKKALNEEKNYKFWIEVFLVYPLYSFASFMEINFETLTIYYLSPLYTLMSDELYFFITKLIFFLFHLSSGRLRIVHFLIAEFSEIFALLGYMVYLEILELNFCGLSDNIGKNLAKKGDMEFRKLSKHYLKGIDEDESQVNEDDETNKTSSLNSQKIISFT